MIYENVRVGVPYLLKEKNRKYVHLDFKDGFRTTITYARYLMEIHLGRYLNENEHVHHKDEDQTNDSISNLEIKTPGTHISDHMLAKETKIDGLKDEIEICFWCEKKFVYTVKMQMRDTQRYRENRVGPFCGRRCNGKYSRSQS